MSYRAVDGFPLVAVVGMSRDDIFSQSNETLQHYLVIGSMLTAIVLVVMMLGAAERKRVLSATAELQCSKQSLEQSNRLLHAALGNMSHGLSMFDGDRRLVMCNDRYAEMYGLRPEQIEPGATLQSILEARIAAGKAPVGSAEYVTTRVNQVSEQRSVLLAERADRRPRHLRQSPAAARGRLGRHP